MRVIKSPLFDNLVKAVKAQLEESQKGREFVRRWSDAQIRNELKDPCFFGVKSPIRREEAAVNHFKRIAGVSP